MASNPFLTTNLNLASSRHKSSHTAPFYSPQFSAKGIQKNDEPNPFQRDYLISPEINRKCMKNKDYKNKYQAKTKREIEMKWEKQQEIENHRRYIKVFGIDVMKYSNLREENDLILGKELNEIRFSEKNIFEIRRKTDLYNNPQLSERNYGDYRQNKQKVNLQRGNREINMLQEQIPTFKCGKNQNFNNKERVSTISRKSSISDVLHVDTNQNDYIQEKQNIRNAYNQTKNNLFKSSFLRKKDCNMGYESYTSNFYQSSSNWRQSREFSENSVWPEAIEYQGVVFEFVNIN